ncbi:MAG: RNA methyltransferase [Lachnospiraceae bacterium]|nr:RNA methyltransferase [Candidatus Merdinaster equi]
MISSTSNKKITEITELQNKSKARREKGLYIIEGRKLFLEAPVDDIVEAYVEERIWDSPDTVLKDKLKKVKAESVSTEVMKKMCDTKTPQGILAVLKTPKYALEDMIKNENVKPLLLIIEELQDPGNLGTLLRTGEGAGVTGIILSPGTVDIYNPKVIRGSMGSIFRMPVCQVDNLDSAINRIKSEGIKVYAAHLKGEKFHDEFDYATGTAFLIGNEGNGLTQHTADQADCYVRIPMEGKVESLNAAIAGTLLIYEANRQRRRESERK